MVFAFYFCENKEKKLLIFYTRTMAKKKELFGKSTKKERKQFLFVVLRMNVIRWRVSLDKNAARR